MDVEARPLELGDLGLDHHILAEGRGDQELHPEVDHRIPGHAEALEHRMLGKAGRLEQAHRAGVEIFNIAGEIDDAGGVAVAPLDAQGTAVSEHSRLPLRAHLRTTTHPCRPARRIHSGLGNEGRMKPASDFTGLKSGSGLFSRRR